MNASVQSKKTKKINACVHARVNENFSARSKPSKIHKNIPKSHIKKQNKIKHHQIYKACFWLTIAYLVI